VQAQLTLRGGGVAVKGNYRDPTLFDGPRTWCVKGEEEAPDYWNAISYLFKFDEAVCSDAEVH
jgi:hypothetical protein